MAPAARRARLRAGPCALVALALLLAACSRDDRLPGERLPVRPVDPATEAPATLPGIALPPAQVNADWTHPNGSASGRIPHPALAPQPVLRWSVNIGQGSTRRTRLIAGPVVGGGLVYTLDAVATVSAVTPEGAVAWRTSLIPEGERPEAGFGGGVSFADGTVFAATGYGEVVALDAASGGVRWRAQLDAPVRAAPTVLDGQVYAVARSDTAVALDAATGAELWRVFGTGGSAGILGGASPAAEGPLVVIPFSTGEVLGLTTRGGIQAWGQAVTGGRRELVRNRINDVSGDPVIAGEVVYASNQSGRTIALARRSGERLWTISEGSFGPAWPVGNSVFLVSDLGAVVRVDAATGQVLWSVQLPEYRNERRRANAIPHYGPLLAGGRLWVASGDELLRAFAPETGALLGTVALPAPAAAEPAIARGVMYVVTTDGRLHAFQ
jgi:outer membrane protein assembly factor BamB